MLKPRDNVAAKAEVLATQGSNVAKISTADWVPCRSVPNLSLAMTEQHNCTVSTATAWRNSVTGGAKFLLALFSVLMSRVNLHSSGALYCSSSSGCAAFQLKKRTQKNQYRIINHLHVDCQQVFPIFSEDLNSIT